MAGFSTVNGLSVLSHRGKIVRTYQPKKKMPDRVPVVRREGNEALLGFLGNPSHLEIRSLKQYLLAHGKELVTAEASHKRGEGGFSFRSIYMDLTMPSVRFADIAHEIDADQVTNYTNNLGLPNIAKAIACRLGAPDQVLDQPSGGHWSNLQEALSIEKANNNRLNKPRIISNADFSGLDLSGLNLSCVSFQYCEFFNARLSNADFRGSTFFDCYFYNSNLSGADFEGAHFKNNTTFIGINMQNANFSGARFDLAGPTFSFQNITGKGRGRFFIIGYNPDDHKYYEIYWDISDGGPIT